MENSPNSHDFLYFFEFGDKLQVTQGLSLENSPNSRPPNSGLEFGEFSKLKKKLCFLLKVVFLSLENSPNSGLEFGVISKLKKNMRDQCFFDKNNPRSRLFSSEKWLITDNFFEFGDYSKLKF